MENVSNTLTIIVSNAIVLSRIFALAISID